MSTLKTSNIHGHCVHSMKTCRSILQGSDVRLWFSHHGIDICLIVNRSMLRAVFHDNDVLFLPLCLCADGRCADVRCRARGGRGCAAVSADHCQLITVQPTQALALREPLHGPHQRGRCFSTCSPFCLPPQHTQHLHTENTCSQESRWGRNVNKAEPVKKKANMNK